MGNGQPLQLRPGGFEHCTRTCTIYIQALNNHETPDGNMSIDSSSRWLWIYRNYERGEEMRSLLGLRTKFEAQDSEGVSYSVNLGCELYTKDS
jgi:hypothetical protein